MSYYKERWNDIRISLSVGQRSNVLFFLFSFKAKKRLLLSTYNIYS